jgi:hypothetical protein
MSNKQAGIAEGTESYRMTVVTADFDEDGWLDIFAACDSTPSLLFTLLPVWESCSFRYITYYNVLFLFGPRANQRSRSRSACSLIQAAISESERRCDGT